MTTGQTPKHRETPEQEAKRVEKMVEANKERMEKAYPMGIDNKPRISSSGRLTSGN